MLLSHLVLLALATTPQPRTIWPEQLGEWKRVSSQPVAVSDRVALEDYGLEAAEKAEYRRGPETMIATGYRFRDAVAGYAGYLWLRPADAKPNAFDADAAEVGETTFVRYGNYVFVFSGGMPVYPVYEELLAYAPELDQTELSPLRRVLPPANRVANSERYLLGPESVAAFLPAIPPSVAAFRLGAEGMLARYQTAQGPVELAVFLYDRDAVAESRCKEFGKLPGASVRCDGRYVAAAFGEPAGVAPILAAVHRPVEPVPQLPREGSGIAVAVTLTLLILLGLGLVAWLRRSAGVAARGRQQVSLGLDR